MPPQAARPVHPVIHDAHQSSTPRAPGGCCRLSALSPPWVVWQQCTRAPPIADCPASSMASRPEARALGWLVVAASLCTRTGTSTALLQAQRTGAHTAHAAPIVQPREVVVVGVVMRRIGAENVFQPAWQSRPSSIRRGAASGLDREAASRTPLPITRHSLLHSAPCTSPPVHTWRLRSWSGHAATREHVNLPRNRCRIPSHLHRLLQAPSRTQAASRLLLEPCA